MGDFAELILEVLLEVVWEVYADFVEELFGYKKLKKWQENLLKILCISIFFIALILIVIGALFVSDDEPSKTQGLILLIVGGVVLGAHILFAVIVRVVRVRKEKKMLEAIIAKRNNLDAQNYYVEEIVDEKNDLQ